MTIFVKDNKLCYATTKGDSKYKESLVSLGWQHAGVISGRDMSGNFPTMTKILQEASK